MDTIDEAKWIDKRLEELINHLNFIIKENNTTDLDKDLSPPNLEQLRDDVDRSLKDNFNTQKAMKSVLDFVGYVYKYLDGDYTINTVIAVRDYLNQVFVMFGLDYSIGEMNQDVDKLIMLSLNLRDDIRKTLVKHKKTIPKEAMKDFYAILDDFRDVKLKEAGIEVQDRSQNKSTKYVYINK